MTVQQPPGDRMDKLQEMLRGKPDDTFLLYAIALEHKKSNDLPRAVEYLDRVIRIDPGYCYAYHQKGLAFESAGDLDAARLAYREGIEAAQRKGDEHARQEIEGALMMIE